jgi:hypothetical protein
VYPAQDWDSASGPELGGFLQLFILHMYSTEVRIWITKEGESDEDKKETDGHARCIGVDTLQAQNIARRCLVAIK